MASGILVNNKYVRHGKRIMVKVKEVFTMATMPNNDTTCNVKVAIPEVLLPSRLAKVHVTLGFASLGDTMI